MSPDSLFFEKKIFASFSEDRKKRLQHQQQQLENLPSPEDNKAPNIYPTYNMTIYHMWCHRAQASTWVQLI